MVLFISLIPCLYSTYASKTIMRMLRVLMRPNGAVRRAGSAIPREVVGSWVLMTLIWEA